MKSVFAVGFIVAAQTATVEGHPLRAHSASILHKAFQAVDIDIPRDDADALAAELLQVEEPPCEESYPPDIISEQCRADLIANFCEDNEFEEAFQSFQEVHEPCLLNLADLPVQDAEANFFEVEPCFEGVEDFTPTCEAQESWMCQMKLDFSMESMVVNTTIRSISSQYHCLPRSCTNEDFDRLEEAFENDFNDFLGRFNNSFVADLSLAFFCDDDGVPANFGPGTQTEVGIEGTVDADATFTFSCEECEPAWDVAVEIGAGLSGAEFGNVVAASLNANEDFVAAGCKAVWLPVENRFNVYCEDDAEISAQVGSEPASRLTEFAGNGLAAEGTQTQFGSDTGGGTNAASATSSGLLSALFALLLAATQY